MSGKTVRVQVLERDGYHCQICGVVDIKSNPLTMHHIKFKSQGGSYTLDNLVTWCWECHRKYHAEYSSQHKTYSSSKRKIRRIRRRHKQKRRRR